MRPKVYVAGPLTKGDRYENVHAGIMAGRELIRRGFAPFIPHLTHFADPNDSLGWETWLEVEEAWLAQANAVLRLPGESAGADREVDFALLHYIPVFGDIDDLEAFFA